MKVEQIIKELNNSTPIGISLQGESVKSIFVTVFKYALVFCLSILAILYLVNTVLTLIFEIESIGTRLIISIQIIVEFLVILHAIIMLASINTGILQSTSSISELSSLPDLDIILPTKNVELSVIERMVTSIRASDYPREQLHIIIADDTHNSEYVKSLQEFCTANKVTLIHDPNNHQFKAGMVNIALKASKSSYVAFFDHDQLPTPTALKKMVSILHSHQQFGFVQMKQKYDGMANASERWVAFLYMQYFEIFETSGIESGNILFAGSTACFRRKVLEEVNYMPTNTFTEDNDLSLDFANRGIKGYYLPEIGSIGKAPDDYDTQVAQFWRWSHGGGANFRKHFWPFLQSKNMGLRSKLSLLSFFAVPLSVTLVYLYLTSFVVLFALGSNSPRPEIYGVNTVFYPPILILIVTLLYGGVAIQRGKGDYEHINLQDLPWFTIITFVRYDLTLFAGLFGLFRIMNIDGSNAVWNPKFKNLRNSAIASMIGVILFFSAIYLLQLGFSAAIIFIIIAMTLIPAFPITAMYR